MDQRRESELPDPEASIDPELPALWWVSRAPVSLGGMALPLASFPLAQLCKARGVQAVVSLVETVEYDWTGLRWQAIPLEDLAGRRAPTEPALELERVRRAAQAVYDLTREGVGTIVHCQSGVGRTGTVLGAVLVALGHPEDAVAAWLDAVQRSRGRSWPESPWQRDVLGVLGRR